ncbi:hypothetical protein CF319_g8790 [Tilletia indica]|nr:hypothetical protein CF319_g8790 [Tilletia indica]
MNKNAFQLLGHLAAEASSLSAWNLAAFQRALRDLSAADGLCNCAQAIKSGVAMYDGNPNPTTLPSQHDTTTSSFQPLAEVHPCQTSDMQQEDALMALLRNDFMIYGGTCNSSHSFPSSRSVLADKTNLEQSHFVNEPAFEPSQKNNLQQVIPNDEFISTPFVYGNQQCVSVNEPTSVPIEETNLEQSHFVNEPAFEPSQKNNLQQVIPNDEFISTPFVYGNQQCVSVNEPTSVPIEETNLEQSHFVNEPAFEPSQKNNLQQVIPNDEFISTPFVYGNQQFIPANESTSAPIQENNLQQYHFVNELTSVPSQEINLQQDISNDQFNSTPFVYGNNLQQCIPVNEFTSAPIQENNLQQDHFVNELTSAPSPYIDLEYAPRSQLRRKAELGDPIMDLIVEFFRRSKGQVTSANLTLNLQRMYKSDDRYELLQEKLITPPKLRTTRDSRQVSVGILQSASQYIHFQFKRVFTGKNRAGKDNFRTDISLPDGDVYYDKVQQRLGFCAKLSLFHEPNVNPEGNLIQPKTSS